MTDSSHQSDLKPDNQPLKSVNSDDDMVLKFRQNKFGLCLGLKFQSSKFSNHALI